ncbi:MAG: response regulator transcription factor [Oscillospiraceae bacterium]
MKKILVCEDEDAIREFEIITLRRSGYEVVDASCGEDAIKYFEAAPNDFSVVLLDIMMPGIDGFTVCKKIREKNSRVGIIMLSAKTQEMDKVNGLMLGADDYVTKPFSPSELAARVDAICRRVAINSENAKNDVLTSGPFTLNLLSRTLTKNGTVIDLTQVEFQLMELFLSNEGTALERKYIIVRIWGENYNGDDKLVDVNIRRLRMKIEDEPSNPEHLQTVWGYGYKWMP